MMIDYSKFTFIMKTSNDLYIFDTYITGRGFGNNGFGEEVRTKMNAILMI